MSGRAGFMAFLALALLSGCGAHSGVEPPRLLTGPEIAALTAPDPARPVSATDPTQQTLEARGSALRARAAALRRDAPVPVAADAPLAARAEALRARQAAAEGDVD